jgi:hypothetical protein
MPDHETLDPNVHSVAILLPWYLNGTLGDDERRQVTQHLAGCEACRFELEELTVMRVSMKELYASDPVPSSQAFKRVMAQITAAPKPSSAKLVVTSGQPGWPDHIEGWLRALFVPKWVPALAVALIVAQLGLLVWTVRLQEINDGISTRSVDSADRLRLRIAFQPFAQETQIRSVMQQLQARFISGPLANGVYFIEVSASDTSTLERIDAISRQQDVVRMIEPVKP